MKSRAGRYVGAQCSVNGCRGEIGYCAGGWYPVRCFGRLVVWASPGLVVRQMTTDKRFTCLTRHNPEYIYAG